MTYIAGAVLGLIFGSFITMLTHRLPQVYELKSLEQWKAISLGGSRCPGCKASLTVLNLIPVFSWLISRGKCSKCGISISWRYPLIELMSASLIVMAIYKFGFSCEAFLASVFLLMLLTIAVIDLEHFLILDSLSYPLIVLGLGANYFGLFVGFTEAAFGALAGYFILWSIFHLYRLMTGKLGMGYGDFKLLAALGAWLGLMALPQLILIASVSALGVALVKNLNQEEKVIKLAFGPYLAFSGAITLFFGLLI